MPLLFHITPQGIHNDGPKLRNPLPQSRQKVHFQYHNWLGCGLDGKHTHFLEDFYKKILKKSFFCTIKGHFLIDFMCQLHCCKDIYNKLVIN